MHPLLFVASAAALAVERVAYAVVWQRPDLFERLCRRLVPGKDPVDVLAWVFAAFKVIQATVFVNWWVVHGNGLARASDSTGLLVIGVGLVVAGQVLNLSVFARLGRAGVFYGNRLGHDVPWCRGFPFSLVRHPQYVGTVLSIWGVFVVMRCPAPDWAVLPLLETGYYLIGALAEQAPTEAGVTPDLTPPATAPGPHASRRLP